MSTGVFDCDSHVFEPIEIWTKHLDPEYRVSARSAFYYETDGGPATVILNGRPARPMSANGINRHAIWRPGMTPERIGGLDPKATHPINPGAHDPKARLADMDTMGISRALLLPTLFSEYFPLIENPDVAWALARAYNDWIEAFAATSPARLIPAAVLPMQSPGLALHELARVAGKRFPAVVVRPSYFNQRFPNHHDYDAVWAEIERLGLAACIVPSAGSTNPEWTSMGSYIERVATHLRIGHPVAEAVAPMMDSATLLTAFCFFGHLERYPRLKTAFLHGGASWLPLVLEKSETYLWLMSSTQDVTLEPEELFFERPSLIGFDTWETSIGRMPEVFGSVAAWGSRYPQHDASSADEVSGMLQRHGVSAAHAERLLEQNAARFFGVESASPAARD